MLWQVSFSQSFIDVTTEIPLANYQTGNRFGSGLSAEDFDQDGDIDIYILTGQGFENLLLRNDGFGNFEKVESNLALEMQSRSAVWFDYNNDGRLDIFVAGDDFPSTEFNPIDFWKLFEQTEYGDFVDVTMQSGIGQIESESVSGNIGGLCAGDLNMDGFLDILVTYYTGNPFDQIGRTGMNAVLLNQRDGSFELRNDLMPFRDPTTLWMPAIFDFDGDGFNEVYIAEDHRGTNYYFDTDGLFFTNQADDFGLGHDQWDMGITICDFNNDSNYDLYVTNIKFDSDAITGNSLLQNNGEFQFTKIETSGLNDAGWSWGATAQDFDNDGDFDLAVTNGYFSREEEQSKFWKNNGEMSFQDASISVGFSDTNVGTSLVSFDFDGDSDLDIIQILNSDIGGYDIPIRFLKNDLTHGDQTNYINVIPRMLGSNKWAIGTSVSVEFNGNVVSKPIVANTGFYSQEPAQAFFGLKDAEIVDKITVTWPGGGQTILEGVSANQSITVTDEEALHPPQSIVAVTEAGMINLSWDCESETTGFIVERSESPGFSEPITAIVSEPSFIDSGIEPFTDYYYRIRSQREGMTSLPSFGLKVVSEDEPVSAPTGLIVLRETSSSAKLTWRDNAHNEINYRVFRSLNPDFEGSLEFELRANIEEYVDKTIEPGFDYFYKVRAERYGSVSNFSNVERATHVLSIDQSDGLIIYPSPSSGVLHVSFTDEKLRSFEFLNASGQSIEKWTSSRSHKKNLNVEPGVYFLKTTSDLTTTRKIVVE